MADREGEQLAAQLKGISYAFHKPDELDNLTKPRALSAPERDSDTAETSEGKFKRNWRPASWGRSRS